MASLGPFMGNMGGGGGGGAPAGGAAAAGEEAVVEEVKAKDKTHFDVELTSFDPKLKIKLIKEVRGLLGLGLKDAKDTVEGAPKWLKKDFLKEDAEAMKEALEKLGAVIRLA